MTGINAYDGATGWKIEPWQGKKDPEALSEEEMRDIIEESDFDGPLINYQEKGNRVELVGMDQVEGTDAFKLKVTLANGDVRYYYMDTDYYVPIRIETKRMIRGAEQEFETSLGDYKEVAGWYLPHSFETGPRAATTNPKSPSTRSKPTSRSTTGGSSGRRRPDEDRAMTNLCLLLALVSVQQPQAAKVDSETISGLGARNIGSAAMSGRIAAIAAVHEGDRLTVYAATASGGVWKSVNGGTTFKPVFDRQPGPVHRRDRHRSDERKGDLGRDR